MTTPIVRVEGGFLAGMRGEDGTVFSFKGIPYAQPPVGRLRWKPPLPPSPWSGTRPAQTFGSRSIQPNRPPYAVGYFPPEPESEDCLTLNIWTSAAAPDEGLPVIVWFHGGAFLVGSGSLPIFCGEALARRGAVVVTVNYRLGRLGFLAHPALSAEQPYRASGNYGHLDQIAALQWIKTNIAAFGGDPARVTISGQSAGASSVCTLMASPIAKDLFHRAIGQSGGAFFAGSLDEVEKAERSGHQFAHALGARSIDELRAKPAREIQLARPPRNVPFEVYDSNEAGGIDRATAWTVIDGLLLDKDVFETFSLGLQNDVPLLTGATADEGSTQPTASSLAEFKSHAQTEYPEHAAAFLDVFSANSDEESLNAGRRAIGTRLFNWENWTWAKLQSTTGKSEVHFYQFDHVPPKPITGKRGDLSRDIGAFHTAEIPYVFQTLDARSWPWRPEDRELSDIMAAYWINFAASGNPNGPGLPEWPTFHPHQPKTLYFSNQIRVGEVPERRALEFWTLIHQERHSVRRAATKR